jgi:hypothetical protein
MYWIICFVYLLSAAPHSPSKIAFDPSVLKEALRSDQLTTVKSMGPDGYKYLRQITMSESESIEQRWQAVLAMAKIGQNESRQDLEAYLKSPTWFLRSSSLLGLSLIEKEYAQKKAKELLHSDRALLVRTSALQVLSQSTKIDRDFLWKELYNPINFRNGRGLSIRASLLKVLSQNPQKKEKEKFLFLTNDKDPTVKKLSMQALESVVKR